jgi:CheY-like chemotaxis protein
MIVNRGVRSLYLMKEPSKILVVDDSDFSLEFIVAILEDDYTIQTASSGEEAWKLFLQFKPDLVLLDIMLPCFDGYEICSLFKNNPINTNCNVILISGNTSEDEIQKGFECGASAYITKPFEPDELIEKTKKYIR